MKNSENCKSTIEANVREKEETERFLQKMQKREERADADWFRFKEFFIGLIVFLVVCFMGYLYFKLK